MSLAEIENELERLTADELHRLAVKSWAAFTRKQRDNGDVSPSGNVPVIEPVRRGAFLVAPTAPEAPVDYGALMREERDRK